MRTCHPEQLLDLIAVRVRAQLSRQYYCLNHVLLPALAERGVRIVQWDDLKEGQRKALSARFQSEIFPLLTPLSLQAGPGRSFPRLVSLGLSIAVSLRRSDAERSDLGFVPVPSDVDRFLPVPESDDLILLEEVVGANVSGLFTGAEIEAVHPFRATRIGDVALDEDNRGSLLARVADGVESRPFMPVIRLEVAASMPREVRAYLLKAIRDDQPVDAATLTRSDIYEAGGPVDLTTISEVADRRHSGCGLSPDTKPSIRSTRTAPSSRSCRRGMCSSTTPSRRSMVLSGASCGRLPVIPTSLR